MGGPSSCRPPRLGTMASINRQSKMLQHLNYKMRITIADSRHLIGRFMSFDRHMNIVLGDCEEYRKIPAKKGKGGEEREESECSGSFSFVVRMWCHSLSRGLLLRRKTRELGGHQLEGLV